MRKYSVILFVLFPLLFISNTLTAQESYYSEKGNYTITGVVKKESLVEYSNVEITKGLHQIKGIVIKKDGKTYVEGENSWWPYVLEGVFHIANEGELLIVKDEKMGELSIIIVEIKKAKIRRNEGVFEGTIILQGDDFFNYIMKEGLFYYNSGEVFVGDMTKQYAGIPIGGELTLTDGRKKKGDWLSSYNFTSSEYELIQEKEQLSEKLFVVKNLDLFHQAKNRAEIAEQEGDFSLALEHCRDALACLKLLEKTSSTLEEMETRLLYKKIKQDAQQAECEKKYSLALKKYDEAQKYNNTNNNDDIKGCIERVQSLLDEEKRIATAQQKKLEEEAKKRERQRLIQKYGVKWADLIEKKKLSIGMPRDAVFEFMPKHVYIPNKITTGGHVTETYRIDMNNAYMWIFNEASGNAAGAQLLYEQMMMIKMLGGNPDAQIEKAVREMFPKLVFKDGKLYSFSTY